MPNKLIAVLFSIVLFAGAVNAQTDFGGRAFDGIVGDFKAVGAVARVTIKSVSRADGGVHQVYRVESLVAEAFKGGIKKNSNLTFYFDADEDYDPQVLVGKDWIVFLEKKVPVPTGGTAWYELENSKIPASAKLDARLRKLKKSVDARARSSK